MTIVQVLDKWFKPLIGKDAIHARVQEVAAEINRDYEGETPLFLGILNGSFVFAADLFRAITIPAEISFIKLASYKGTSSSGNVVTAIGLEESLQGRHVIIVEDIVDTGGTLSSFLPELMQRNPASVRIACFLQKPEALQYDVTPDYVCFSIPNQFVVGYGLDYDGHGRQLPDLYVLADQ